MILLSSEIKNDKIHPLSIVSISFYFVALVAYKRMRQYSD